MKKFKLAKRFVFGCAIFVLMFIGFAYGLDSFAASQEYNIAKKYTYEVSVSNPLCIEDIMCNVGLTAMDGDDDLTDSITYIDSDDYINKVYNVPIESARELGEYQLNFRVIDASSSIATCKIYVNVVDDTAPVIDKTLSKLSWTFEKGEVCSNMYNIIQSGIRAHDGFDVLDIDYSFEAKSITTSSPAGNYTLKVNVSDQSGNTASTNVTVIITDAILPYFVCDTGYVETNQADHTMRDEVLGDFNISALDSTGKSLQVTLINSDDLPTRFDESGLYEFVFSAEDSTGKSNNIVLYLYVIDDQVPKFYLDYSELTVVKGSLYDLDRIDGIIAMRSLRSDFTYEVVEDNYTMNKDTTGEYSYKINVNYSDGTSEIMEFTVKVIEDAVLEEVEELKLPEGFFNKVKFIILTFFKIVLKIVSWPLKKLATFF